MSEKNYKNKKTPGIHLKGFFDSTNMKDTLTKGYLYSLVYLFLFILQIKIGLHRKLPVGLGSLSMYNL